MDRRSTSRGSSHLHPAVGSAPATSRPASAGSRPDQRTSAVPREWGPCSGVSCEATAAGPRAGAGDAGRVGGCHPGGHPVPAVRQPGLPHLARPGRHPGTPPPGRSAAAPAGGRIPGAGPLPVRLPGCRLPACRPPLFRDAFTEMKRGGGRHLPAPPSRSPTLRPPEHILHLGRALPQEQHSFLCASACKKLPSHKHWCAVRSLLGPCSPAWAGCFRRRRRISMQHTPLSCVCYTCCGPAPAAGNATRIDYGTGHETTFAALLYCLAKAGVFCAEDAQALVTRVFSRYITLMRKVQKTYWCARDRPTICNP